MENFVEDALEVTKAYAWVVQVFIVVLVTLIVSVLARQAVRRIGRRAKKTHNMIDDVLFRALLGPTRGLIWIIGIAFAAQILGEKTGEPIFAAIEPIRDVGVIAMIAWFLVRFVSAFEQVFLERKERGGESVDRTLVDAVGKLLRASVLITALLVVLQTLGFNIAGLLAFGGIGGIAVGLAARDLMANLFGGLTIYLDRPFSVGDWVRSPDRNIEGTVQEIGWRRTAIQTFDKRLLYVPNSAFLTISVENPSRMSHRRIKETVGVRYDDMAKIPVILESIREFLQNDSDIDQSQTLMVNLNEFGASSVNFFIYTFTRTTVWTEYHAVKERVMLEIARIITDHGAEIAFPTTTVHIPEEVEFSGLPAGAR